MLDPSGSERKGRRSLGRLLFSSGDWRFSARGGAVVWSRVGFLRIGRRSVAVLVRREDHREEPEDDDADQDHDEEGDHREPNAAEHGSDVEEHPGRMAGTARIDPMTEPPSPTELPASLTVRRGRIVFRARRPVALVLPLFAVTEVAGVICLLIGATIGWFIMAAPLVGLATTAVVLRPTLELTRDGLVQRQYPYSSLTRWDVIANVGIVRAGNRVILGYKLVPDVPPPRHQPAAELLREVNAPYDGGWFADSLAGGPDEALAVVTRYLQEPGLRAMLPITRR
jgi:hypothetical protein